MSIFAEKTSAFFHVSFRKLPFQEKHSLQQASIIGNMAIFGILKHKVDQLESEFPISENGMDPTPAVVEFGAGRGYLTQMLVDCYGIYKVFLVERRAYKLKVSKLYLLTLLIKYVSFFVYHSP